MALQTISRYSPSVVSARSYWKIINASLNSLHENVRANGCFLLADYQSLYQGFLSPDEIKKLEKQKEHLLSDQSNVVRNNAEIGFKNSGNQSMRDAKED